MLRSLFCSHSGSVLLPWPHRVPEGKAIFPMKHCKIWIFIITFAFALSAKAEVSAEKRAEIDTLLRLTGMEKLVGQIKSQMISSLKSNLPDAPAEFWDKFSAKMDVRELIE